MTTKKSYQDWKTTAASVDWPSEIQRTLDETGWTKVQLANALGLYIQPSSGRNSGPVSPHIYTWLRGKHKPKFYLLYALRYLRSQYGLASVQTAKQPSNPTEPVDEH